MQPAYYEDFKEIKKKIWSMLDDAVTNRSSQFRIPVFVCGDQKDFDYTMEQSEEGYKNFTVIKCKIKSIEWLYLAAKGHRRAKFDLENKKESWLVP